jgi:hypothetical protein
MKRFLLTALVPVAFATFGGGCSDSEKNNKPETAQAWSAATVSPARELGVAAYTVARERDGSGFVLKLWNNKTEVLDSVRVTSSPEGRVRASLEKTPGVSVEWTRETGWQGDLALRSRIAEHLSYAAVDAAFALDLAKPAGAADDTGSGGGGGGGLFGQVATRNGGLIDVDAAEALVNGTTDTTKLECPSGLALAVAAAGALLQLALDPAQIPESPGAEGTPDTDGPLPDGTSDDVQIASFGVGGTLTTNDGNSFVNTSGGTGELISSILRGVADATGASQCSGAESLMALASNALTGSNLVASARGTGTPGASGGTGSTANARTYRVEASNLPTNIPASEAPTWQQLAELNTLTTARGTRPLGPRPIFNSNNPESFDGWGQLAGTVQPNVTTNATRLRAGRFINPAELVSCAANEAGCLDGLKQNPQVPALRRNWTWTNAGASANDRAYGVDGCPSGGFKRIAFYAHHINGVGQNTKVWVLLSPHPENTAQSSTVTVLGSSSSSAVTGWQPTNNTAIPMTEELLGGRALSVRQENVRVARGSVHTALVRTLAGRVENGRKYGDSFDARFSIDASECMVIRVVATPESADATKAVQYGQQRFATGEIQCPGCRGAAARGTVSGLYGKDHFAWTARVPLTQASGVFGYRFDSIEQAPMNIGYYASNNATQYIEPGSGNASRPTNGKDSDDRSWANYGADYEVGFTFVNQRNTCVALESAFMVYPGTRPPTNVSTLNRGWVWAGWARSNQHLVQLIVAPNRTSTPLPFECSSNTSCSPRKVIAAGGTADLRLFIPIPALISAPAGLIFKYRETACP